MFDESVQSVDSFIIENEKDEKKIVKKAEKLFEQKALENSMNEDDLEGCLEDGYYDAGNGYTVYLTWSNVQ
jgi:hypothetical protein